MNEARAMSGWVRLLDDLEAGKIISLPCTGPLDLRRKRRAVARRAVTRGLLLEFRCTDVMLAVRRQEEP